MRRGRLLGLVVAAAFAAAPAQAQDPIRAEDSATVTGREVTESPGRLRLFLDDTVLSKSLVPRLAFSAALDQREGASHAWGGGDDKFAYNDPHAPDATALLGAFIRQSMQ